MPDTFNPLDSANWESESSMQSNDNSGNSSGSPLSITTDNLPDGAQNVAYSTPVTADGGASPYTWSATGLPDGLSMSSDGSISGTPTAAGTFTVTVTVTDSDDNTDTKDFSLLIAYPVQITTTTLGDGTVGVAYSQQVDATGGRSPYTWVCTDLPPGLSISSGNASSTISGTPTEAGTYVCHVSVTDSGNSASNSTSDSKTFTITIADAPLSITTTMFPDGTVNNQYLDESGETVYADATGGTEPYSWSANDLPDGLSMSTDGSISGTPTTEGDYEADVQVQDADSPPKTAQKTVPIKIKSLTLAGPNRIGQVKTDGVAKEQKYTVTVSEQADAASVKLKKNQKSTGDVEIIMPPSVQGNTVTFTVKGKTASDPGMQNDVTLTATSDANPTGDSIDISVVIPAKVSSKREQGKQIGIFTPITIKHVLLNSTTTPPYPLPPGAPANQFLLGFVGAADTTIEVVDQYGVTIGDIYLNASVSEGGMSINSPLKADSTYIDKVGYIAPYLGPDNLPVYTLPGTALANQWTAMPDDTFPDDLPWTNAEMPVEVDGFPLNPGLGGREVRVIKPNSIEVRWP
jgi:hypothetical protein